MAWAKGESPYYSSAKNAEVREKNAAQEAAQAAAHKADAAAKGLIDSGGSYKQDELGRSYNASTGKWEAGPNTSVARAGYTNEAAGGGSSGLRYSDALSMANNSATYNPVNQNDYMKNVLSYEDALAMAKNALEPQYARRYEQSAAQAAQNLGASGLYDSVYGQALSAEAQRDIDRDLEAAIQQWAQQLVGSSRDEALSLLQLAIGENQFGANFNQNAKLEDRAYAERNLDRLIRQANADRDYNLAAQGQALQERIQNYYESGKNWEMKGFDSKYQMEQAIMQLENDLQQSNMRLQNELTQQSAASRRYSSGSGNGGSDGPVSLALGGSSGVTSPTALNGTAVTPSSLAATSGLSTSNSTRATQPTNNTAAASEAAGLARQIQSQGINNYLQMLDYINSATNNPTVGMLAMVNLGITQEQYAQWLQVRNG